MTATHHYLALNGRNPLLAEGESMQFEQLPIFDWAEESNSVGNDFELIEKILPMLIASLKQDVDVLKQAHREQDEQAFRARLHRSKGGAASFGVPRIHLVLQTLEDFLPDDWKNKSDLLTQLERETESLAQYFDDYLASKAQPSYVFKR